MQYSPKNEEPINTFRQFLDVKRVFHSTNELQLKIILKINLLYGASGGIGNECIIYSSQMYNVRTHDGEILFNDEFGQKSYVLCVHILL